MTDLFVSPLAVNEKGFPQTYEDGHAVCFTCHAHYTNLGNGLACESCRHDMEWYEDMLADMGKA